MKNYKKMMFSAILLGMSIRDIFCSANILQALMTGMIIFMLIGLLYSEHKELNQMAQFLK